MLKFQWSGSNLVGGTLRSVASIDGRGGVGRRGGRGRARGAFFGFGGSTSSSPSVGLDQPGSVADGGGFGDTSEGASARFHSSQGCRRFGGCPMEEPGRGRGSHKGQRQVQRERHPELILRGPPAQQQALLRPLQGGLPPHLMQILSEAGWNDTTLGCLVENREDAERILRAVAPQLDEGGVREVGKALLEYALDKAGGTRRVVRRLAQAASLPRVVGQPTTSNTGEIYEQLVSENVELAQKIHKSRGMRMKKEEGTTPEMIEQEETRRWACVIAGFVADGPMPAKVVADATADPSSTWVRFCGNRRSRTLRQAARSWQRFSEWLRLSRGRSWPAGVEQIVDYLEERMEPCGPTVPGTLLQSLQLLETVGGMERDHRLGLSPMLINVVKNMKKELSLEGPPRKTAPIFAVAMVMSAELLVVDYDQGVVARLMAYIMLLMVWGAMRTDDLLWLDRSRTMLSDVGWKSVLVRTKTSGAGRRIKELPVFVARGISITGKDWLGEGHLLWQEESKRFPGNLFLCRPREDGCHFTRRYLDAAGLATWLKWVLLQLPSICKRFNRWCAGWEEMLLDEDWVARWSGHSARHCLPSWAAAVGVAPEHRAFLGRWKCGTEVDANSYVLTSRQIVHGAQETVLKAFCGVGNSFSETEVFEELKAFGIERGLDYRGALASLMVWKRRGEKVALFTDYPTFRPEPMYGALGTDDVELPVLTTEEEAEDHPFWVSISRRSGFRRLHKKDGCGVKPESVHKAVELDRIDATVADKKCLVCFGKASGSEQGGAEDSTSGSSSSSSESKEDSPVE